MNNLDRRISIAPMMDWSDSRNPRWHLNNLLFAETACSSFVATAARVSESSPPTSARFKKACGPQLLPRCGAAAIATTRQFATSYDRRCRRIAKVFCGHCVACLRFSGRVRSSHCLSASRSIRTASLRRRCGCNPIARFPPASYRF